MIKSPHTFHIPVMGTSFTIDTPLKVARYGISSVISLVDDVLIEQMRKFYCKKEGKPYEEITSHTQDSRALRITAYLNMVHQFVQEQVKKLKESSFVSGSEITKYFRMLPENAPLKRKYRRMLSTTNSKEKSSLEAELKEQAVPGSIDVNIMTKLDRNRVQGTELDSDAMCALRGYANSALESSIIFSAGMNQHLYSYAAQFPDFLPKDGRPPKKSIILKVTDFRSAEIQGKFLAKRGLWVSEFRIESGLNCGGHAFPNKGILMGPILEEFKRKKAELLEKNYSIYRSALASKGIETPWAIPNVRITVQGGIGTFEEDEFLRNFFCVDGTGWGTPFLLVPEAVNVDDFHLQKLSVATEKDVYLSDSSPLNVPFWMLRTSKSEMARLKRIEESKPGSACPKGYLASSTEFTKIPICSASYAYQKLKLEQLSAQEHNPGERKHLKEKIMEKACICHDLAGAATVKYGIDPLATTTVCCGPNIANFSKIAGLEEMVNHIYGRISLLTNPNRRHMFLQELSLYVEHLRKEMEEASSALLEQLQEFKDNILNGINYYKGMAQQISSDQRNSFINRLNEILREVELLIPKPVPVT